MRNIIKKAVISEKSFQNTAGNKYTFIVDKTANKQEVAKSLENLFGINVISINIMNYIGKIKMTKKNKGKRADYKKAIVLLKPGQKIDLFDIETPQEPKAEKKEKPKKETKENKDVEVKIKKPVNK